MEELEKLIKQHKNKETDIALTSCIDYDSFKTRCRECDGFNQKCPTYRHTMSQYYKMTLQ